MTHKKILNKALERRNILQNILNLEKMVSISWKFPKKNGIIDTYALYALKYEYVFEFFKGTT